MPSLATFIPPPVEPPQAPIMVKIVRIACENAGHLSKSAVARPVVELILVTWKNASGSAFIKLPT